MRRGWRMSRPISAAYLERKLRAILGVQGANPLPDLVDVNGLLVLESDRPEWSIASGELLWGIARSVGPVVGQQSFVGVHVPANRGIVSIVERVTMAAAIAAADFSIAMNFDTAQPGDGIVFVRDFRASQLGCGTRRFEGSSAAPTIGNVVRNVSVPIDQTVVVEGPWILPSNAELGVFCLNQNLNIAVSIEGYERPLEGTFEIK